jgi:hypothetical protein
MKEIIEYPGYAKCSTFIGCSIHGFICSPECMNKLEVEIEIQCGEDASVQYEHLEYIPENQCFCQR